MSPAPSPAPSPDPLHLVLGDEELLVERALQAVVAAARAADARTEVRRLRAAEATPEELATLLSPSLFAEARVVVLEAAHEAGKDASAAVLEHAVAPGEGITVVVQHAGGARNKALADAVVKAGATVARCERPKPWERRRTALDFVRAEVRAVGGRMARDAVEVLVDAIGTDLRELAAAARQLVADTEGAIDPETVRRYHRGHAEVLGFAVADKVMAGDREGALEALHWVITNGTSPVPVADALSDMARTLGRVGAAGRGDPNRLAGALGMPPGKIRTAQQHVRSWSPAAVAAATAAAAEANADVRGAAADPVYALERAVLRMCAARESRG